MSNIRSLAHEKAAKTKLYKNPGSVFKSQEYHPPFREKHIMDMIMDNGSNALIRTGNFATEIIWGKKSFVFTREKKSNKNFRKGLFLFNMVRRDVKKYIADGNKVKLPKQYPVNDYNEAFDIGRLANIKITATDINHAYWRIALNEGYIRRSTYEKGLNEDFKSIRLAALSTLGAGREYMVIKDGEITDQYVRIGGSSEMANVYKAIRYKCYGYMMKVKEMLGDDFIAYRTDCIYYADSKENKKIVRDFFKAEAMLVKQLVGDKKSLHRQAEEND